MHEQKLDASGAPPKHQNAGAALGHRAPGAVMPHFAELDERSSP
jgi:hypothetical protein